MKIYIFSVGVILVFAAGLVFAQNSIENITYPVQELGGCKSQTDCRAYCDEEGHEKECLDFAEKYDLVPKEEIDRGRKLLAMGKTAGPGGCKGESCEAYCDDVSHIKECIQFAKENGILEGQELEEAEKVLEYQESGGVLPDCAPDQGPKPPKRGPKNKTPCSEWCAKLPENAKACFKMGKAMGGNDMPDMTEEQFVKMMTITGGKQPCQGEGCCDEPENQMACEEIGQKMFEAGIMPEKDMEKIREGTKQMRDAISDPNLPPEVVKCFEEKLGADLIAKIKSGEDFMPSRKMGDAMGECFNQMGSSGENGQGGPNFDQMPQETIDCLKNLGINSAEELKNFRPTPEIGQKMKECFRNMPQGPKDQQGAPCKSPEECENGYPKFDDRMGGPAPCGTPEECCQQDPSKCPLQQMPPEGDFGPKTGPGGCQSEQECEAYCQANPQECGAPPRDDRPPENFARPEEGRQPPTEMMPPLFQDQPQDQMPPQDFQQQQPPNGEAPPTSWLINPDSFAASVAKALFGLFVK